jgi:hypothetical protein
MYHSTSIQTFLVILSIILLATCAVWVLVCVMHCVDNPRSNKIGSADKVDLLSPSEFGVLVINPDRADRPMWGAVV